MKNKTIAMALCALLILTLAACGGSADPSIEPTASPTPESGGSQIANPWESFETMEAAAASAGFALTEPESLESDEKTIRVGSIGEGKILEVIYKNGEDELRVRKAAGEDDVSGDFGSYAQTDATDVDGLTVTMKGDGERVYLATWTSEGWSYSASASAGMTGEDMAGLVSQLQ